MRQPGAHVVALRQRMDLRLVLQAPEGRTEDDAIPVLLEGVARRRHWFGRLVPESLRRQEPGPLHRHVGHCHAGSLNTAGRSEEHTSELQSLMRISYAVFCLKKKNKKTNTDTEKAWKLH